MSGSAEVELDGIVQTPRVRISEGDIERLPDDQLIEWLAIESGTTVAEVQFEAEQLAQFSTSYADSYADLDSHDVLAGFVIWALAARRVAKAHDLLLQLNRPVVAGIAKSLKASAEGAREIEGETDSPE